MPAESSFVICPHCWHLNPPSRICAGCFADMTTRLQETGGRRWTAASQSPMPVRAGGRLSQRQRWLLLGALVLFAVSQVALALAPAQALRAEKEEPRDSPAPVVHR
ncbi:MAG: hypothetical protein KY464_13190 [Gemmatimonadetes bacterium]|nr:hypothetical protein [Gemmatimonadota bacterium]